MIWLSLFLYLTGMVSTYMILVAIDVDAADEKVRTVRGIVLLLIWPLTVWISVLGAWVEYPTWLDRLLKG